MNDELKAVRNLGAELGAAKAENEAMRILLRESYSELLVMKTEVGFRGKTLDLIDRIDTFLSQQPEPTDAYTAVDMATAAAQGFRDGQAAVEPAPAHDERKTFEAWAKTQGDKWLIVGGLQWSAGTDDYASARTNAAWAAWQERAALSARPAQTEHQPLIFINPMVVDELEGRRKPSPGGLTWSRKACAHWTFPLYAAPIAQTEQQPVLSNCLDLVEKMTVSVDVSTGDDDAFNRLFCKVAGVQEESDGSWTILAVDPEPNFAALIAQTAPQGKFRMGDLVKKSTGSEWVGRVVGWYSTEQTKEGYAVESSAHRNSVQIYPVTALEAVE